MKNRNLLLLWIIIPVFTSCITTSNIKVIKAEFFQKGILATDSIDTIAVFNRDYNDPKVDTFYYLDAAKEKMVKDTLIKFKELSNTCVDALADFLRNTGYFKAVINYRDSLDHPAYAQTIGIRQKKQNKLDYDACVFLDYMSLRDELMTNSYYFDNQVIASFPEFENSTMMETVGTWLRWRIVFRNDSSKHSYRRMDNLFYGNSVDYNLFGSDERHRNLLKNTAGSLGESFANELVPHYQKSTRTYYRSNNPRMLAAEKKLQAEDYIGAAEIYRPLTRNKNKNIAAKAAYNMALICEIEGNMEATFDWLNQSEALAKPYDYQHFFRCRDYVAQVYKRQKEIETLNNPLRNKMASQ
ncbi:MAG: DUF6340 family protein [Candidatus Saccharibacteria bacterium]